MARWYYKTLIRYVANQRLGIPAKNSLQYSSKFRPDSKSQNSNYNISQNKEKHKYIHIMSLHLKIHCDTLNFTFIRCDILLFSTILHISPHPAATCPHERL